MQTNISVLYSCAGDFSWPYSRLQLNRWVLPGNHVLSPLQRDDFFHWLSLLSTHVLVCVHMLCLDAGDHLYRAPACLDDLSMPAPQQPYVERSDEMQQALSETAALAISTKASAAERFTIGYSSATKSSLKLVSNLRRFSGSLHLEETPFRLFFFHLTSAIQ